MATTSVRNRSPAVATIGDRNPSQELLVGILPAWIAKKTSEIAPIHIASDTWMSLALVSARRCKVANASFGASLSFPSG